MELNKDFKESDFGTIPCDWEIKELNAVCLKIQDGTHFSPRTGGLDHYYVTSKNIGFGYLKLNNLETIDKLQHQIIYKRCDVKKGDVLLTKDGASTGNAAINKFDSEISLLSSVAFMRTKPDQAKSEYLLQQLLSNKGQNRIKDAMAGNAITRLTLGKIKKFILPFPKLIQEQEAIANALSEADTYIESLEKLIAKKRLIKKGVMQELLTGKRRLNKSTVNSFKTTEVGLIPKDWLIKKLGEVFEISAGRDLDKNNFSLSTDNQYRFPTYSNALTGDGLYGYSKLSQYKAPAITITARGDVGHSFFRTMDFSAIGRVLVLSKKINCNMKFVSEFVNQNVKFSNESTGVPQLTAPQVSKYLIALPPTIEEQDAISNIILELEQDILKLEKTLTKSRLVKQGMMQELLTGRIRLI